MKRNNIVKYLTLGLVAVSLAFGAVACSKDAKKDTLSKDTLVVGFDDTFVPMGYKDDKGEIVGFDVDLAKEALKRMGKEVKFQPIDWSMKESELNGGNIDFIWNGYTITDERKEKVAFTNPYLDNRQVIVTLANSKIATKNDLKGTKVGTQSGSSSLDALNSDAELVKAIKDGKPVLFDTYNEAFMDLEAGRIDSVVADEILARYYINQRGAEKYKVLAEDLGKESYGIGVRKDDKELLDKLNKALDDMKSDGTAKKISEKWFGENIVK